MQKKTIGCCNELVGLRNANHADSPTGHSLRPRFNGESGNGPIRHQARNALKRSMVRVKPRWRSVVLHAEEDYASIGVRQRYNGIDQLLVRQTFSVALEFNHQSLATGKKV